jgi:hypothetical protein
VEVTPNPSVPKEVKPYRIATQFPVFKTGAMGQQVTVWSSVEGEGGHEPLQLMHDGEIPVVISLADEDVDQALAFAAGYIYGWVEKTGGDGALDRLEIWLEPYRVDDEIKASTS